MRSKRARRRERAGHAWDGALNCADVEPGLSGAKRAVCEESIA
jgi:hypothetical protein